MKSKPTVLGLLFKDSDPSATLIRNGELIAFAEEERFIYQKHAVGFFPLESVKYCLEEAGIDITEVDIIAVGWDASKFPVFMSKFYLNTWHQYQPCSRFALNWQLRTLTRYTAEALTTEIKQNLFNGYRYHQYPKLRFINHHFAHACSSYMVSGFKESAILTADGHGEDDCVNFWVAENGQIDHLRKWTLPHSLGWFYTKFTQWFGFRPHDGEGKLMGLAAYGNEVSELIEKVHKVIHLTGDENIFRVNSRFFFGKFVRDDAYTQKWIDLFGEPCMFESGEDFSDYHKDLAYAVQYVLEEIVLSLSTHLLQLTRKSKLCVSGGTFMNCKMNGLIAEKIGLDNFFVQPVSGDNGVALGAALAVYYQENIPWTSPFRHLYFGPAFENKTIEAELKQHNLAYQQSNNISRDIAEHIASNKIVGWFQGRMEAGARALGNRSILGNPLNPDMKNLINKNVKFRESWRPFCPATTYDEGKKYFKYSSELPYMIVATDAYEGVAERLPSVVHVDNTVRVQTVDKATNTRFYSLIEEFKKITGVGVLLNTSFNVKGEPIVHTPADAIKCFMKTGIDVLAIGDYIVIKNQDALVPFLQYPDYARTKNLKSDDKLNM